MRVETQIGRLWAGTEDSLHALLAKASQPLPEKAASDGEAEGRGSRLVSRVGPVGVIHIAGGLVEGDDAWWNEIFGLTGYGEIRQALVELARDASVQAILLDVNSPGGAVSGMSDVADLISTVDQQIKPVLSHTSGVMLSAGYMLGVSARRVSAGRMADVGSIGVIVVHREITKRMEMDGIAVNVIRSGDRKALGNPYETLSDKARETIQTSCDYTYARFMEHVAGNRGVTPEYVRQHMAEGRVFTGEQARAAKLVDAICTYDEAVAAALHLAKQREGLARPTALLQHGSEKTGLADMKKSTLNELNPLTAAAQAMLNGATEAPVEGADQVENAESASEGAPEQATQAQSSGGPGEQTQDVKLQAKLEVLTEQLAQAQAQLLEARSQMQAAQTQSEASAKTVDGLRQIARQGVRYLCVALGQAVGAEQSMSDEALVSEHARLHAMFDANFKAGGVASVSAKASEDGKRPEDPMAPLRIKAARITTRK